MPKGYWITVCRSVSHAGALSEYAKLAGPARQAFGGRFLTRGNPVKTYESGLNERSVVVEFDRVERAIAAYESPAYQAAFKLLQGHAERDLRIVEGSA
jgi:uncharacterized protein (DUF1330 family)